MIKCEYIEIRVGRAECVLPTRIQTVAYTDRWETAQHRLALCRLNVLVLRAWVIDTHHSVVRPDVS